MWVFRLRHDPQEEGPRPPPCADLLWGYAGTVSMRTARRSAPCLAHEPFHDSDALLPVFDAVLPHPDLRACGGRLPAPREGAAQGIAIDVPRALPQPREGHGLQRPVRTEMLRPVRVIGEDVADDLGSDLLDRQAMERVGRLGAYPREHEAQREAHGSMHGPSR